MARRGKEMNKEEEKPSCWGTLEELLLASAVSRHGPESWDSVSAELRRRTSDQRHHFTPPNCRRRYTDLRRRFTGEDVVAEMRRLRVEELRREVEKHDVSIEFLELKLKKLEAEREEMDPSAEPVIKRPAGVSLVESVSGGGSEGRSLNESNSITNPKDEPQITVVKPEPKVVKSEESEPADLTTKLTEGVRGREGAAEWCDSVDESKKSSESRKKRRRRGRFEIGSSSGEDEHGGDEVPLAAKQIAIKCQPLIKILATLRSHKNSSVFERRLRSQESEKYEKMIRQPIDLQTVQWRLEGGFYLHSRCKFFRDLLLLFTNALVFFPNISSEYYTASELRKLVITEMDKAVPKADVNKNQFDPVQKKPVRAPSPPIVVCRRRSSNGLKPTPNSVAVANSTKEAAANPKMKNPKFDMKAKESVIVKKPAVTEKNTKSNNTKKPPVKVVESSSSDETDDVDKQMGRGRNMKAKRNGKRGGVRRTTGKEAESSKLAKGGRPGKGSPPMPVRGGRGGKRGKGSGRPAVAEEDPGPTRKRPRR